VNARAGAWGSALALALLAALAPAALRGEEDPGTERILPLVGPSVDRVVVRPDFRHALDLREPLLGLGIAELNVDLVLPTVLVERGGKPVPAPGRLLLQGTPEGVARGREALRLLDAPEPAVVLHLVVAETRARGRRERGGSIALGRAAGTDPSGGVLRSARHGFEPESYLRATLSGARSAEGHFVAGAGTDPGLGAYAQVLRMLVRRHEARVVAKPSLVLRVGAPAALESLVQVPELALQASRPAVAVVAGQGLTTGWKLEAIARRVGNETAVVDLDLWIGLALPSQEPDAGPADLDYATRRFTTRVLLRDRETHVLGGIVLRSRTLGRTRLPILDALDPLGLLASGRSQGREATEILVLVGARILRPLR
jgi:type II secretory pathway component GspD/PulD (secretin)